MDSPLLQSAVHQPARVRAHSTYHANNIPAHAAVDKHGAIHKRSNTADRNRSISTSQADRLYRLAAEQNDLDQPDFTQDSITPSAFGLHQWITPQHSPEPHGFATEQSIHPFPQWTAPTPPRSDSGIPNVPIDSNEEPVTCAPDLTFDQPASSAEMSSLGFLLPSQYGTEPYSSEPNNYTMDQNYIPPMRMTQPTTTAGTAAYAQTASSSPALYQSRGSESSASRRQSEMPATTQAGAPSGQSYDQSYRRVSNPYDSMAGGNYSVAPSQTIPSISGLTQSPLPSPHMGQSSGGQMMPQYNNGGVSRSPSMYDSNVYGQPYTTAPGATQLYPTSQNMSYPQPYPNGMPVNDGMAKQPIGDSSIRVLNQRPKPQCWEHGCNGRQFSTFSNLLRHQREKSGTAAKSYCPKCGAEFTRTTARNGHLAHDKCTKQRRQSDGK
ncbi:hypothetical protein M409DRAFT_55190 [Zasmidium cellare ATCC 36951]|uniref:C2H2-type domain-containing protein n=1 Tax=Zasmidium cellare ATCC 36951 TaxID=1080233 RepID=A0A6A6CJI0_ZASCE|nr:uncharacterized protein M409DRAFT_55190 [Zasmidium cellare ATCC 36951]KAF2166348.1 hypothetical protein M409DRAFT_55190 [Zasmidium cellare ATCC 36951]